MDARLRMLDQRRALHYLSNVSSSTQNEDLPRAGLANGGPGWRAPSYCAPRWGRRGCTRTLRRSQRARESATSHIAVAMCSNLGLLGSPS
jgi:hypothetical protein